MTIPIIPGPFSFLAELGKGVGTAFDVAEKQKRYNVEEERKSREEALGIVKWAYENATKKESGLSANILTSPAFQQILQRAGVTDFLTGNVLPQPGQELQRVSAEEIQRLRSNQTPDNTERLRQAVSLGRAPTEGEAQTERTTGLTQRTRGNVIAAGTSLGATEEQAASARAQAGVVSGPVARAAETAATDPLFGTQAKRFVDATLTGLKVDRIDDSNAATVAEQAWQLAQNDARSKGFVADEMFTKAYIDAAVQSKRREQEELDIKRLTAESKGGDTYGDMMRFYQRQAEITNAAINTLQKSEPTSIDTAFASGIDEIAREKGLTVQQVLADPQTPADMKKAYIKVQQYDAALADLQREAQGYRDNMGVIAALKVGAPDLGAPPVPSVRRQVPGGRTGAIPTAPAPQAAADLQARKRARFNELVGEEQGKLPGKRKTSQQLQAIVEQEARSGTLPELEDMEAPAEAPPPAEAQPVPAPSPRPRRYR